MSVYFEENKNDYHTYSVSIIDDEHLERLTFVFYKNFTQNRDQLIMLYTNDRMINIIEFTVCMSVKNQAQFKKMFNVPYECVYRHRQDYKYIYFLYQFATEVLKDNKSKQGRLKKEMSKHLNNMYRFSIINMGV